MHTTVLCKDCRFVGQLPSEGLSEIDRLLSPPSLCMHDAAIIETTDVVTGQKSKHRRDCKSMRISFLCDRQAKLFQPRDVGFV